MVDEIISISSGQEETLTPPLKKEAGGWKSVKYIIGNESFEKLASMGLIANLTVYLKTVYNMDGIFMVNVYNVWSGTCNVTPLLGAFLSDSYLGRFRTLLFGSIASFLGMGVMTLTAAIPEFRPLHCFDGVHCQRPQFLHLAALYLGLGLLAIGAGGVRPCNIAFGADQFDTRTDKGKAQLASFFNWWYFSFTVSLVIALTVVVYVQSNVSWAIGYAIPTACLFLSISIFLIGKHTYIITKPQGSVFVDMAKVVVASSKKGKPSRESALEPRYYDPPLKESEDLPVTKLAHSEMFSFLDRAARIDDPSELDEQGNPKNPWRLCSVQQVEQLKLVVGLVPVWFTGIGCFITMDQMNTFGLMQAIQMNNRIGTFHIPPGWMGLTSMICLSIWILFYERFYLPKAKKRTNGNKDGRFTLRQRINTGIVMAILCMVVAGIVEKQRRIAALQRGTFESPLHMLALTPQFALSGLNEAFAAVSIMEYYTNHLPESMRTISGAIFFLSFSAASYINTALVNLVHTLSVKDGKIPWLGGRDLNTVTLDKYYFLIGGLACFNLMYFNVFAYRYLTKKAEITPEPKSDDENEKQLAA
ncbi:hypothetical protein Tsubulata_036142 [Turnera subulata]|uniref:Uncharacterized protein n=1 Tax=Turnera subulata TaxID=218843 RepID=A0A9Q0G2Z0_9ROSI|nr:hypothetical protein Tsubulata_036142 [Turnera subulata]